MFLSDWRILLHRWYAVVVGLVATVTLVVIAAQVVPVTYAASAHVVLLPPRASEGIGTNPYLGLGGLDNMADVVSLAMMDDKTAKQLIAAGVSNDYTVVRDRTTSGPILLITAEETSSSTASASLETVIKEVPVTTLTLQTDTAIPESALIEVTEIGKTGDPEPRRKSQIRALLVVLVGGLSLTVLGTSFLDSLLGRRAARRREPNNEVAPSAGKTNPTRAG